MRLAATTLVGDGNFPFLVPTKMLPKRTNVVYDTSVLIANRGFLVPQKPCFVFDVNHSKPKSLPRSVRVWGWCQKQVLASDDAVLKHTNPRTLPRQKWLSLVHSQWVKDLTEEEVEPNPGPRAKALKNFFHVGVLSLSAQGGPGAWTVLYK